MSSGPISLINRNIEPSILPSISNTSSDGLNIPITTTAPRIVCPMLDAARQVVICGILMATIFKVNVVAGGCIGLCSYLFSEGIEYILNKFTKDTNSVGWIRNLSSIVGSVITVGLVCKVSSVAIPIIYGSIVCYLASLIGAIAIFALKSLGFLSSGSSPILTNTARETISQSVVQHQYRCLKNDEFASIAFERRGNSLNITISTKRLILRSVQDNEEYVGYYVPLFQDEEVMKKYAEGKPWPKDRVVSRISAWAKRWKENDPFSAFAVFLKSDNQKEEFIGHFALGHGYKPGEAETGYVFHKKHWQNGYGSEASRVIMMLALAIIKEGYILEGKPLNKICGSVRNDNYASVRILENTFGMSLVSEEERYGALRKIYSLDIESMVKRLEDQNVTLVKAS